MSDSMKSEEINGVTINYRDTGTGPPVLLIHAFPLNLSMWDHQVRTLSREFRTIAPDLRGFGHSGLGSGKHSVVEMAGDVKTLLERLGIQSAILVGLSMGGYVAMAFYRNNPAMVSGLVLADTRAGSDTEEAREKRFKSADKAEREGARAIADDVIPGLLGKTTLETKPAVVERVRQIIETNSPAGIAAAQRAMANRQDMTETLSAAGAPALVVVGSEDSLTTPSEAERLTSLIPGASMRVIDHAGHLSNLEQPELFDVAILDFLRSCGG
jgi:pimeloyl-ACP methyl ester carboxylesterase